MKDVEAATLEKPDAILNSRLSDRQQTLWSSYLVNIEKGPTRVRAMMNFDLEGFVDLCVHERSSDIKAVLQVFFGSVPGRFASG